jgi:hypothetical protein
MPSIVSVKRRLTMSRKYIELLKRIREKCWIRLKLSKLRAEHPMLTLIELIYVKKKHEKLTLACKGDTLPALLVWFHHNLAGFSNSNNGFCCFLSFLLGYNRFPSRGIFLVVTSLTG